MVRPSRKVQSARENGAANRPRPEDSDNHMADASDATHVTEGHNTSTFYKRLLLGVFLLLVSLQAPLVKWYHQSASMLHKYRDRLVEHSDPADLAASQRLKEFLEAESNNPESVLNRTIGLEHGPSSTQPISDVGSLSWQANIRLSLNQTHSAFEEITRLQREVDELRRKYAEEQEVSGAVPGTWGSGLFVNGWIPHALLYTRGMVRHGCSWSRSWNREATTLGT